MILIPKRATKNSMTTVPWLWRVILWSVLKSNCLCLSNGTAAADRLYRHATVICANIIKCLAFTTIVPKQLINIELKQILCNQTFCLHVNSVWRSPLSTLQPSPQTWVHQSECTLIDILYHLCWLRAVRTRRQWPYNQIHGWHCHCWVDHQRRRDLMPRRGKAPHILMWRS